MPSGLNAPTPITRSALPEIRTDDGIGQLPFILPCPAP